MRNEKGQFVKGHNFRVGMRHSKISNEKNRQSHLGKNLGAKNASWKGGVTPLLNKIKRLTQYKEWQTNIMKRDNYTCRKCKERGGYLTPHHLTSLSFLAQIFKIRNVEDAKECLGLWNIRNGVTLCKSCHSKTSNFGWRAVEKPRDRFVYPMIVILLLFFLIPFNVQGATFGYTSIGANSNIISTAGITAEAIRGTSFSSTESGTLLDITIYLEDLCTGVGGNLAVGVYRKSDDVLLTSATDQFAFADVTGWQTISIPSLSITAQDYVLIGAGGTPDCATSGTINMKSDSVSVTRYFKSAGNLPTTLPSPFDGTIGTANFKYSIYATYIQIPTIADFSHFSVLTMCGNGGGAGCMATTTTGGYVVLATTTQSFLLATTSGGRIEVTVYDEANNSEKPLDLIFTDDDDNLLDFCIESWASTTPASMVVHFKHMDVSSTTEKTLKAYFGNPSATGYENCQDTFSTDLGFAGRWALSEDPSSSAPQMLDSTANNNDGISGGTMLTEDQVAGQIDGALSFDGVNDYVDVEDNTSLDITGALTFFMWFKTSTNNTTGGNRLVSKYRNQAPNTNQRSYEIVQNTSNRLQFNVSSNGSDINSVVDTTTTINDNIWHHAVAVFIPSVSQTIYLDGTQIAQDTTSIFASIHSGTAPLSIGIGFDTSNSDLYFDGTIDDVRIYNIALHSMDILSDYNMGVDNTTFLSFGAEQANGEVTPAGSTPTMIILKGAVQFIKGLMFQ